MQTIQSPYGRFYKTPRGDFPSVNTVLNATMPQEKKDAIARWEIRTREKWLRDNRKCKNCKHHNGSECTLGHYGAKTVNTWKKNRCKDFDILEELDDFDPRKKALNRGSSVHDEIEKFLKTGELSPPDIFPQGEKMSYFLGQCRAGALKVEEPVFSTKHGYAGRVDYCGVYREETVVIDWTTTGRTYIQKDWYADKLTQAAAYATAIEEMDGYKVDQVIVVVMNPGKPVLFRDPLDQWQEKWLARLEQYKFIQLEKNKEVPF